MLAKHWNGSSPGLHKQLIVLLFRKHCVQVNLAFNSHLAKPVEGRDWPLGVPRAKRRTLVSQRGRKELTFDALWMTRFHYVTPQQAVENAEGDERPLLVIRLWNIKRALYCKEMKRQAEKERSACYHGDTLPRCAAPFWIIESRAWHSVCRQRDLLPQPSTDTHVHTREASEALQNKA